MANPKTYFVRIKPHNKKRGYLVRNYMHRGVRFTTRWKEVSAATANELQHSVQPHDVEEEIPLFDIKTKDEALEIEAEERDATVLPKKISRVKDAERIPDRKFRNDKPEIIGDEIVEGEDFESAEEVDQKIDALPAPSLKPAKKKSSKRRSRTRD